MALDPAFLHGRSGRIHCTFFRPEGAGRDALLLLPPFAEEMNRTRPMMARLGHALAERGCTVALPDLFGTGDSEGDFGDATWAAWRSDVVTVTEALRRDGVERLVLGGVRTGALLALDSLADQPLGPGRLLLWQPVTSGRQFLTQFLRLRVAAAMAAGGKVSTGDLRERLAAGEALEIAGYTLSPALAAALDGLELNALVPSPDRAVDWLEVSGAEQPAISAAGKRVIEAWQEAGCTVTAEAVPGDPFWATQEIVEVPALIEASLTRLHHPCDRP